MASSERLRHQLSAERARRAVSAGARLLAGENSEQLHEDIEWVGRASRLLDATPAHQSRAAVLVTVSCLALVGVLYSIKMLSTTVVADVDCSSVHLELASNWSSDRPISANQISIERVAEINSPGLGLSRSNTDSDLFLKVGGGGQLALDDLAFGSGSILEIAAPQGYVQIAARGAPMSARVTATGELNVQTGTFESQSTDSTPVTIPVLEMIEVTAAGRSAVPTIIRTYPGTGFRLAHVVASAIAFKEETIHAAAAPLVESSIASGKLKIPSIGLEEQIQAGDLLVLKGLKAKSVGIVGGERLRVTLEGDVSSIALGPPGSERDLTPRLLNWLYHEQRLTMIWGAICFTSLLLWRIHAVFVG